MRLDPDEFDYVYYTYGLKLYRNMPLIKPLEYREVKRIQEFVIAIDTSTPRHLRIHLRGAGAEICPEDL